MRCCKTKEFLKELNCCKQEINVWRKDCDLQQIQEAIRNTVKEYFPLNGVPQHIVDSLDILRERISLAEDTIVNTIDRIIAEIEKEFS